MITDEQRANRTKYIGSSDAAAVLGLSRWGTPLKVWAEKTGQILPEDLSDNLAVEIGTELEDLVCKMFTKRTGKTVRRVNETLFHPRFPFIGASIDRRVVGEDSVLEAKTASGWKAKEWAGEDIPQEYIIQCFHQLAVTGKDRAYLAVLIGGNQSFLWKTIERDEKLIKDIIRREVCFWREFVEMKVMPTTITRNDADTLYQLFPLGDETDEIDLGDEANKIIEQIDAFKEDSKVVDANIQCLENELKAMLKDSAFGKTNLYKISWKNQITKRLDTRSLKEQDPAVYEKWARPVESRVLRVSEIKKGEKNNGNASVGKKSVSAS